MNAVCGTNRLLLLVCFAFSLGPPARPGARAEGLVVIPSQIVSNALAHSFALRAADREVDAARAGQAAARATGLPSLALEFRAGRYAGLQNEQLGPDIVIPEIESRYAGVLSLSQPLYVGGRIRNETAAADSRFETSLAFSRAAEADLALQSLSAYWNWAKAYHAVDVYNAAVARTEAHAADMHNKRDAGLVTENEVLSTDVLLDRTRLHLEEAQRRVALARARIAFLTGKDLPASALPERPESASAAAVPSEEEALAASLSNRAERAALEADVGAAESLAAASRAELAPQVFASARYEQANPNLQNFPPQDKWQDDLFAGVTVTWSLFDWGLTRARAREAAARAEQARLRREALDHQLALEIRESRVNLQNSLARATVAERVEQSAWRNVAVATDLWQNGLARHSNVLDAHAELTDAQYGVIAARADARLARAALEHAMGRLAARE